MENLKLQRLKGLSKFLRRNQRHTKIWCLSDIKKETKRSTYKSLCSCALSRRSDIIRHVLSVLSLLACLMGCSVHTWYISDIYFKYEVTTSMSIETNQLLEIPAITVCMGLKRTFNKRKWYNRFGVEHTNDIGELPHSMTVGEINEMGPGMEKDGIVAWSIAIIGGFNEQLQKWRPTLTSIDVLESLKCETFFLKTHRNSNISYLTRPYILMLFKYFDDDYVHLVGQYEPNIYRVYVHPSNEKVNIRAHRIHMKAGQVNQAQLTASTRSILLPAPYTTDCLNYSSDDHSVQTRADCVDNCLLNNYRKNVPSNEWPTFLPIYLDDSRYNWTVAKIGRNSYPGDLLDVYRGCGSIDCAKPDCVQSHVNMHLVREDTPTFIDNSSSLLVIQFPAEASRTYTSSPKIDFVEYVCYVGGVVSLWRGISAIGSFTYIQTRFQNLKIIKEPGGSV